MRNAIDQPDSRPAWTMAWTLSVTETISWGILYYAFSALMVPMQRDLGWSSGAINGAYSLAMVVSGFAAPAVGRWLDRHGARGLMVAGSILGTASVVAWSRVDSLPAYYLVWVLMGLAMAATLYEPAFAAIVQWFQHRRGRAMLLVTILAGFASTIFLPLTTWLEARSDWRSALLVLAGVLAVGTILPHALLVRGGVGPVAHGHASDRATRETYSVRELVRQPVFQRITLAMVLQTTVSIAVAVHMIAYLVGRGETAAFAAWATGLIGAAQVAARVFTTMFERRFSVTDMVAAMFASQALAVVSLLLWHHPAGIVLAVVLLGMGRGALTLLRPSLLLEFYDVSQFGVVTGVQSAVLTVGRALAPVATGLAATWAGGRYEPVFWVYVAMAMASAIVIWPLRRG